VDVEHGAGAATANDLEVERSLRRWPGPARCGLAAASGGDPAVAIDLEQLLDGDPALVDAARGHQQATAGDHDAEVASGPRCPAAGVNAVDHLDQRGGLWLWLWLWMCRYRRHDRGDANWVLESRPGTG
jgi:hypothetical protein